MIRDRTVLAVVPARGGSKGAPRKNVRLVAGKPLIEWTILEARKSAYIDRLIFSSEDEEIISVARSVGYEVPFIRPAELASDEATGSEVVMHALSELPGYDIVLLLQPATPMRTVEDIDGALDLFTSGNLNALISLSQTKTMDWMFHLEGPGRIMRPVLGGERAGAIRQKCEATYTYNGAIYIAGTRWFMERKSFLSPETGGFVMPAERSLDIDAEWDLELADVLMTKREQSL